MRIRLKLLTFLMGGFWIVTTGDGKTLTEEEFIHSGVIPLPARPPSDLKGVIEVLEPYSHLNSRLVNAQIAGWLRLLKVEQLQALLAAIPGPWSDPGPDMPMDFCGLREVLPEVIAAHAALPVASDHPVTAVEAGRIAGKEWKTGMETAKAIEDPKIRAQFLLGLLQSADNARTYAEAVTIRSALIPLLPDSERSNFSAYEEEKRAMLWPAGSIVAWVMKQTEDERFKTLRFILDHGAHYFVDLDEATKFLPHFGRNGPGQSPVVAESMGPVLAARDPKAFVAWWEKLPANGQSSAIRDAIVPLLRHDVSLIKRVLPKLEVNSLIDYCDVTQEWYRYDPAAALEFCSSLLNFAKQVDWWLPQTILAKSIEPSVAVDLINRYPAMRRVVFSVLRFDPRRDQPDAHTREILGITDRETREGALSIFGMKWGSHDPPAALAWTRNISEASDRRRWLLGLASEWIVKSPEEAAKALDEMTELTPEDRTRLEMQLAGQRARLAKPQASTEPSRFAGRASRNTFPLPDGGPADPETVARIRHSLAELARPAEPPVANLALCVEVLDLGEKTVTALLRDFEARRPTDAKENAARAVLLERWVLSAPETAARWMVQKGDGTTRQPLCLALSRIALVDAELAASLADQIPEEQLHYTAKEAILYALATQDHRKACEFGERHNHSMVPITRDWLRADRSVAESWLKSLWRERHYY